MTTIGNDTFRGCSSLSSVTLGSSVTSIGYGAFWDCEFTSINIPSSVKSIADHAFFSCDKLDKVNISDVSTWCSISFEGSSSNPLYYAENLYLNGEKIINLIIPKLMGYKW